MRRPGHPPGLAIVLTVLSFNILGDWRAMLAGHCFDLVCIATPTALHAPQTPGGAVPAVYLSLR